MDALLPYRRTEQTFDMIVSLASVEVVDASTMRGARDSSTGTDRRFDTPSVRSYPSDMPRRRGPTPRDPVDPATPPERPGGTKDELQAAEAPEAPSLAALGIAGVSRRRVAWAVLTIAAAWIVIGFAGQAVAASRANEQVARAEAQKAEAAATTEALRRELELVTQDRWILQQARAYRLGSQKERPFAMAPDAPDLPADAPGSPARRLGAETAQQSPFEAWLEVLFGPQG
jgi:hypothetical protein